MKLSLIEKVSAAARGRYRVLVGVLVIALMCPFNIFSDNPRKPSRPVVSPDRPVTLPDTIPTGAPVPDDAVVVGSDLTLMGDTVLVQPVETVNVKVFNPDPQRAVWLSALCPGLGQLYNRRYWKLPIVVGAYVGLGYATSWNNSMLRDYTRAYADLMDNDPSTRSYMDFFPSTTKEEDLSQTWLQSTFKSRKNFYRRNRDLCIICMVGVYILAMVDAYVDATMTHFDISADLSMQVAPAIIPDSRNRLPGVGIQWALNF